MSCGLFGNIAIIKEINKSEYIEADLIAPAPEPQSPRLHEHDVYDEEPTSKERQPPKHNAHRQSQRHHSLRGPIKAGGRSGFASTSPRSLRSPSSPRSPMVAFRDSARIGYSFNVARVPGEVQDSAEDPPAAGTLFHSESFSYASPALAHADSNDDQPHAPRRHSFGGRSASKGRPHASRHPKLFDVGETVPAQPG